MTDVERIAKCAACGGDGWVMGIGIETEIQCCGGSEWECGASGCSGPTQEQVQVQTQEMCLDCGGSGINMEQSHER